VDDSTCTIGCDGGDCEFVCEGNADCTFTCAGGGCTYDCDTTGTCMHP
jgi:hypothetical protein